MGGIKKIGAVFVLAFTFFSAAAQSGKYYETDAVVCRTSAFSGRWGTTGNLLTQRRLSVSARR